MVKFKPYYIEYSLTRTQCLRETLNYSPRQQVQYAYKGWIAVKRVEIENATRSTWLTGHAMHALINPTS